jgi:hypothetical protein
LSLIELGDAPGTTIGQEEKSEFHPLFFLPNVLNIQKAKYPRNPLLVRCGYPWVTF